MPDLTLELRAGDPSVLTWTIQDATGAAVTDATAVEVALYPRAGTGTPYHTLTLTHAGAGAYTATFTPGAALRPGAAFRAIGTATIGAYTLPIDEEGVVVRPESNL